MQSGQEDAREEALAGFLKNNKQSEMSAGPNNLAHFLQHASQVRMRFVKSLLDPTPLSPCAINRLSVFRMLRCDVRPWKGCWWRILLILKRARRPMPPRAART